MTYAWTQRLDKDWTSVPKLRHNLWTSFEDTPETTYLTVSHGKFAVPTAEAQLFLKMRGFCTGHHSRSEVIRRSGLESDRAENILSSLEEAGVFRPAYQPFQALDAANLRETLLSACRIWSEQMAETNIAVDIMAGKGTPQTVIGWMLETYHYIRTFPEAIQVAADAADGELRETLYAYAAQERGHEAFVLRTLRGLGLDTAEVESSVPLVSTRLIDLLMREMFAETPCSALLLARIVEAAELDDEDIGAFQAAVTRQYGFPDDALEPFFEHSRIDEGLGHASLAERNQHLITVGSEAALHRLVNRLHDIKHAFDLQKLEIVHYYNNVGNYVPRQFVDYFAI